MRSSLFALFSVGCVLAFVAGAQAADSTTALPASISSVMHKPRYAHSAWSLLVTDLATGKAIYAKEPDRLAFTGSVRKLFSVGVALNRLGAAHRFQTPVFRQGAVDANGKLAGNLVLVGAGDLTLGGRLTVQGTVAITTFDHNDANNLGTAILTPQNPLRGLDELARQVRASGVHRVSGDVVIDDRLFESYRVPNGKLLITPILVNENMVDVTVDPTQAGRRANVGSRPKTPGFSVDGNVATGPASSEETVKLSGDGLVDCIGTASCAGTVSGSIPTGYKAPLSNERTLVRTFRIEDPPSFARIAFIQALRRVGVTVDAPLFEKNPKSKLPSARTYAAQSRVAQFTSPPYAQFAKLILKVSLNLGANLSLSLFGVDAGTRTIDGALAAERKTLVSMGVASRAFNFPTNGSGSPDSQAAPRAVVELLTAMARGENATPFHAGLPILGVDGSLAETGTSLPARGHVFAKTGTTLAAGALKAQTLAGYIDTKGGRKVAFALFVNDAGPVKQLSDVGEVFEDEARITNAIYESN